MKKLASIAMVALLMAGTSAAYAQIAIPDQSASTPITMDTNSLGYPQKETTVEGVITGIDLVSMKLTLQDGTQFTLPPSVAETSIPEIGEQVEVTYIDQGGQKVVREIDMGFGGNG